MALYTYNRKLAQAVWWNILLLTIGAFVMAVAVQAVAAPHGLLSGGLMGAALLVWYGTGALTVPVLYLLICLPVYLWGWFFVGRRFLLYTAYGSGMTALFGMFINFTIPVTSELYAGIVAGVMTGAAAGIMLRTLGSAGGTDVVAVALKERWNIPIGQFTFGVNFVLFLLGAFFMPFDTIILSMIMMFIQAQVLEYVLSMFNKRKLVMIISEQGEAVCEAILVSQPFGATMIRGKGAYSGGNREVLVTVTTNTVLKQLENLVFDIDPHALFIVENTFYVSGGQFSRKSYA
ncbi:MAG: YitT family protein [Desulfovibrionaceae bacterium]|nr:YitT family protein [Desulfovibrionaceae bacterium]